MIVVKDSVINNLYHNCEHTPQNGEVEATNIVKKLSLEFYWLQNVQPLVCHDNVVRLAVVGDHENHHANRTDYSHYEDFSIASKKHDPWPYDPKHLWWIHQWPNDLEWNPEEWNLQVLLWAAINCKRLGPQSICFYAQMLVRLDEVPYKRVQKEHQLFLATSQGNIWLQYRSEANIVPNGLVTDSTQTVWKYVRFLWSL